MPSGLVPRRLTKGARPRAGSTRPGPRPGLAVDDEQVVEPDALAAFEPSELLRPFGDDVDDSVGEPADGALRGHRDDLARRSAQGQDLQADAGPAPQTADRYAP